MQRMYLALAIVVGVFMLTSATLGHQAFAKTYKMGETPDSKKAIEPKKKPTLDEARAAAQKSKQVALEKIQKDSGIKSKKQDTKKKHRTNSSP